MDKQYVRLTFLKNTFIESFIFKQMFQFLINYSTVDTSSHLELTNRNTLRPKQFVAFLRIVPIHLFIIKP